MKLSCPACGAEMTIDVLVNVEAAAETLREQSRAHGHSVDRAGGGTVGEIITRQMPEHVREQLLRLGALKRPSKEPSDGQ